MYRLSFYNLRLLISSLLSSNFCYCNYTNNSVSFPLITEYLPNLEWMYWTLRLACILPMYIFSDYRFMIGIWRAESDTFFLQENQIFHRSILPKKILFTNYIIKKKRELLKDRNLSLTNERFGIPPRHTFMYVLCDNRYFSYHLHSLHGVFDHCSLVLSFYNLTFSRIRVSEWLLFYTNSAILQLYHGENRLLFNEMMMRSALY